jgi:hypothetical protein
MRSVAIGCVCVLSLFGCKSPNAHRQTNAQDSAGTASESGPGGDLRRAHLPVGCDELVAQYRKFSSNLATCKADSDCQPWAMPLVGLKYGTLLEPWQPCNIHLNKHTDWQEIESVGAKLIKQCYFIPATCRKPEKVVCSDGRCQLDRPRDKPPELDLG